MIVRVLVASALLLAVPAGMAAQGGAPHPTFPAFSVVTAEGEPAGSQSLAATDRWMLVYVAPGCPPCDKLLASLGEWSSPDLVERTVIVVAGSAAEAAAYIGKARPEPLAGVRWYADAEGEAAAALALPHAPALLGVRSGRLEWKLGGVLNNPGVLRSVVKSWVEPK